MKWSETQRAPRSPRRISSYPGRIVVWVHGDPHRREHVARRDVDLERRLSALGYQLVTIWYDRVADGLRDLASRLGRSDLEGS